MAKNANVAYIALDSDWIPGIVRLCRPNYWSASRPVTANRLPLVKLSSWCDVKYLPQLLCLRFVDAVGVGLTPSCSIPTRLSTFWWLSTFQKLYRTDVIDLRCRISPKHLLRVQWCELPFYRRSNEQLTHDWGRRDGKYNFCLWCKVCDVFDSQKGDYHQTFSIHRWQRTLCVCVCVRCVL